MGWGLRIVAVCGLALSSTGWVSAKSAAPPPPASAESSICRPDFQVGDAQYRAGTAFLLDAGNAESTLLITAHHLFGPDGGLDAQIPWDELPARARMIGCAAYKSGETWQAGTPLAISGAHPGFDEKAMLDIAAFPLSGTTTQPPLRLASRAPAVGDSVWLVAEIIAEPKAEGFLHHAVVAEITDHFVIITYDQPIGITATSGGPIVNAQGDVVGVNFGGGVVKSGKMVGIATAVKAIRAALPASK